MKRKKFFFLAILLIPLVTFSSLSFVSNPLILTEVIPISKKQDNLLNINVILDNFIGECTASISNLYVFENSSYYQFNGTNNGTKLYPANLSYPTLEYDNMTLSKLSVLVTAMTDSFNESVVANNITWAHNGTDENNAYKLAQNFTINETSHISYFNIYVNYSNTGPIIPGLAGVIIANIYPSNDLEGTPMNPYELSAGMPDTGGSRFKGWLPIPYNGLLVNGSYYLTIRTQSLSIGLSPNNNSWQIQNHSSSLDDKGDSLFKYGNGTWSNIAEDGSADFLMTMEIARYLNPEEINLTCYVDNQELEIIHYKEENPAFFKFPWISYGEYYFPSLPDNDINFTFITNRTLGWAVAGDTVRYITFVEANGTFTASLNSRRWVINYTSVNSTGEMFPVFTFPADWTVSVFYDRFYKKIKEYGIMYSSIYNQTFNGLYYPETGDGTTTYNFSAICSSHNYVSSINTQSYSKDSFNNKFNFLQGEKIRIQANIQDSVGVAASGGNCSFYLYNPSSNLKYSEKNLTVINGIANSDNLSTKKWGVGNYIVIVTWTNGSEVGFDSFIFSIQKRIWIIPPPSPTEPILLYIIGTALTVVAVMVGGYLTRKKLQERNWEKSLLHLFIMTKDGRAMYDYPFGIEATDPTLISGMLTAMQSFVKEAMKSKKQLRSIDQEDKKVILGHGKLCTVAVFSEKDLSIIHQKTEEFLKSFETLHGFKVEHWDGSTATFKGVNKLVEKIFPVSTEEKIIRGVGREISELKELIISSPNPQETLSLLQKITELAERYQDIIREHFNKEYGEILRIANEKIQSQG